MDQFDELGKPKAYVSWILLDEQFKFVSSNSGFESVGADQVFSTHVRNDMPISKNGYLYIYVSNETPNVDVYFDNLQVTHVKGQIFEETHYYPGGLTMKGISSKAFTGATENRKHFNGYDQQHEEFFNGSGLDWYDYKNRFYDYQIGRFFVQDKLATEYVIYTPYQFAGNEVPNAIDLDGLEPYADFRIQRDIQDVRSGKISIEELKERLELRGKSDLVAVGVGLVAGYLGARLVVGVVRSIGREKGQDKREVQGKEDPTKMIEKLKKDMRQLEKSNRNTEKNIKEHREKLERYKSDPKNSDNKKLLEGKSQEMQEKIINGRIKKWKKK